MMQMRIFAGLLAVLLAQAAQAGTYNLEIGSKTVHFSGRSDKAITVAMITKTPTASRSSPVSTSGSCGGTSEDRRCPNVQNI